MNYIGIILIFVFAISFQNCASFKALPKQIKASSEIVGLYSNDCDSTDSWIKRKLWEFIEPKFKLEQDSLLVKFEINDNKIKAYLFDRNKTIIREKIIKGKFKNDQCYYSRRIFYIVPILPILWWYNNEQDRFYIIDDFLVYEHTWDTGGVAIIMAGGTNGDYIWKYRKRIEK